MGKDCDSVLRQMKSRFESINQQFVLAKVRADQMGIKVVPCHIGDESLCVISWEWEQEEEVVELFELAKSLGHQHVLLEASMVEEVDIETALNDIEEYSDDYEIADAKKKIKECRKYIGQPHLYRFSFISGPNTKYEFEVFTPWSKYLEVDEEAIEALVEIEKEEIEYTTQTINELAVKLAENPEFQEFPHRATRWDLAQDFFSNELRDRDFPLREIFRKALIHYETKIQGPKDKALASKIKELTKNGLKQQMIADELDISIYKLRSISQKYLR